MGLPDPCECPVDIQRDLQCGLHDVEAVMPGIWGRPIVGEYAEPVGLDRLRRETIVRVTGDDQWPRVHARRPEVHLPQHYLAGVESVVLYLDMIHELVHVRQVLEGVEVYHRDLEYVDWPTEHEAYRYTVEEARRIGCPDDWIRRYLEVPWADAIGLQRLERAVGLA